MNKNIKMAIKIAELVTDNGGRVYYVGGFVRDKLLNFGYKKTDYETSDIEVHGNSDIDIEVHGIEEKKLYAILEELGTPLTMGKSFGVMALKNYDLDIAMPRTEEKIGDSHKDFKVTVSKNLGTYNAAKRRDFTINSIMEDVLTGELVDHFGGIHDIENKVIRHIDDNTFVEDPLRVLRACQFAARFDLEIDEETLELCKSIDISNLSKERICGEVEKVFGKSKKPSIFFRELYKMDKLSYWFKELEEAKAIEQNPVYHPEGDVFEHTMLSLDAAAQLKDKVKEPTNYMFSVLCHDLGKIVSTQNINGKITSIGHELHGVEIAKRFLKRFTNNKKLISYVTNMVHLHMRPNTYFKDKSKIKATNKMFDLSIEPNDLIYVSLADNVGRLSNVNALEVEKFFVDRLSIYEETMKEPYVSGKDLIDAGISPNKDFKKLLEYAHNLRLAGVEKPYALAQTMVMLEKLIYPIEKIKTFMKHQKSWKFFRKCSYKYYRYKYFKSDFSV